VALSGDELLEVEGPVTGVRELPPEDIAGAGTSGDSVVGPVLGREVEPLGSALLVGELAPFDVVDAVPTGVGGALPSEPISM